MTRASDDPDIVLLGTLRARVHAAVASYGSGLFDLGAAVADYRAGLRQATLLPSSALAHIRNELVDRLLTGWDHAEAQPRFEDHWVDLLVRYEAVSDAIDPQRGERSLARMAADAHNKGGVATGDDPAHVGGKKNADEQTPHPTLS